ncbi:MAG: hypothetical protein ABRQ39_18155 [Candidatus Eremiobacterota bacterium]
MWYFIKTILTIILFFFIVFLSLLLNHRELFNFRNYKIHIPSFADTKTEDREIEIYIDLSYPDTGKAFITMAFNHFGSIYHFKQAGNERDFQVENVNFYDKKGTIINYKKNEQNCYYPERSDLDKIIVSYNVKPVGVQKYSIKKQEREGYISKEFACFDGRIFMMPDNALEIKKARLQFIIPQGWQIITPHRKEKNFYYPETSGKESLFDSLLRSFIATGTFDKTEKTFGNTDVYVYSYNKWSHEDKKIIREKLFKLYNYFFENFNFDPGINYIICLTPGDSDNNYISGGSWSNGLCYSICSDKLSSWENIAHRLSHSINQYIPTGMLFRDKEDKWFEEGWAAYTGITATYDTGITDNKYRLNMLYDIYLSTLTDHPEYDFPLMNACYINEEDSLLQYKAPLVVKMLDFEMRKKTGKNIQQFMQYACNGRLKKPFPFKEELEGFTGTSFEEFWDIMIRQKGYVIPVWEEYITSEIKSNANKPCGFIISGEKFTDDYLFYIARNGSIEKYSDLIKYAGKETECRKKLKSEGIRLYPDITGQYIYGFPPQVRMLLTGYEREHVKFTHVKNVTFKANDKSSKILCKLIEMEKSYENDIGKNGITSISTTIEGKNATALGFHYSDKLIIHTTMMISGFNATYELLSPDGKVYEEKTANVEPGCTRTTVVFEKKRPVKEGIWIVRIKNKDKILLQRAFWQK